VAWIHNVDRVRHYLLPRLSSIRNIVRQEHIVKTFCLVVLRRQQQRVRFVRDGINWRSLLDVPLEHHVGSVSTRWLLVEFGNQLDDLFSIKHCIGSLSQQRHNRWVPGQNRARDRNAGRVVHSSGSGRDSSLVQLDQPHSNMLRKHRSNVEGGLLVYQPAGQITSVFHLSS